MEYLSRRISKVALLSLLLGVTQASSLFALESGYIDAVEADVAEFTTQEFVPPEDSKWLGSGDSSGDGDLDDLSAFSRFIQSKSPGSYIFYKKLPLEYKERLHQDYLATGDLDRIKQDIFKYTREAKK